MSNVRVTQAGHHVVQESSDPSDVRVTQAGHHVVQESVIPATAARVTQAGRHIIIKVHLSEIVEDASYDVAFYSRVTKAGSIRVLVINAGEIIKSVSARLKAAGEIVDVASIRITVLSLIQEGFRWRYDDDDEASATWAAAQDTNITAPAGDVRRLRMILDTIGDAPSLQRKLWVRRVSPSATPWRKVEVE